MREARDILITGYPSFVARHLLGVIAADEPEARVRLLVRPDFVDAARGHLERLDEAMPAARERVMMLTGDVVAMDLGLSGMEYLDLIANVTDIFHIASIWYLGVDRKQTREVNVEGTKNVIDAATEMRKLRRLNHFSTAFVAGDRTGVIMEDELDEGQSFRNAYEKTKFEAERLMRRAADILPVSIFRPSLIVGDSRTGEIDKLAGPYFLISAIMMMPPNVPTVMPGRGDKPLNAVPIDFVTEAMWRISLRDDTAGRTFHLCDPNPLSARKVFGLVAEACGRPKPINALPYRLTKLVMQFPYLERLTRQRRQFLDDFNQLTIYNCLNTMDALDGRALCPPFPTYVDRLIAYLRDHDGRISADLPLDEEILG
ncbi:MAG: SDR family oxidoreductase [Myxococcota bacterium]